MRHLERRVGEDVFRDGLREYLDRFRFANATWPDLIAMLDARSPDDLASWSHVWVEEAGRPVVTTALETTGDRIAALRFAQRDPRDSARLSPQRLSPGLIYTDGAVRRVSHAVGRDAGRAAPAPGPDRNRAPDAGDRDGGAHGATGAGRRRRSVL